MLIVTADKILRREALTAGKNLTALSVNSW